MKGDLHQDLSGRLGAEAEVQTAARCRRSAVNRRPVASAAIVHSGLEFGTEKGIDLKLSAGRRCLV
jgi:hypothetical protein